MAGVWQWKRSSNGAHCALGNDSFWNKVKNINIPILVVRVFSRHLFLVVRDFTRPKVRQVFDEQRHTCFPRLTCSNKIAYIHTDLHIPFLPTLGVSCSALANEETIVPKTGRRKGTRGRFFTSFDLSGGKAGWKDAEGTWANFIP